ncbi:MAG: toll/interleukin-1 receptor domain-containing protein [Steroidobacteraceae bacterium]
MPERKPNPAPEAAPVRNQSHAVFISHAFEDKELAYALCAALERASIACWIAPRDVRPGDFYADAIVQAINACPVLVLVLSQNAMDSAHVLREVERAGAMYWEAAIADTFGRSEDALRLRQQAIALDPLSPSEYFWLGRTFLKLGRPADAEASFRKSLDLNPNGPVLHWNIALAMLQRGEQAAALAEMQLENSTPARPVGFALIYHAMGRDAESDAAMREMAIPAKNVSPFWFAVVYAYRGETDRAFAWLERAYRAHDFYLIDMKGFPLLKNLEPDPRYKSFLRKMRLAE